MWVVTAMTRENRRRPRRLASTTISVLQATDRRASRDRVDEVEQ